MAGATLSPPITHFWPLQPPFHSHSVVDPSAFQIVWFRPCFILEWDEALTREQWDDGVVYAVLLVLTGGHVYGFNFCQLPLILVKTLNLDVKICREIYPVWSVNTPMVNCLAKDVYSLRAHTPRERSLMVIQLRTDGRTDPHIEMRVGTWKD